MRSLHVLSLSLALLFPCGLALGQNLVPNPSFEVYDTCVYSCSQIHFAYPWYSPTTATPDYFNACWTSGGSNVDVPDNGLGSQAARTGVAYAGAYFYDIGTDYKEYIQVKLDSQLNAGAKYYVSFYVSCSDFHSRAVDEIGLHFSNDSLLQDTFNALPVTPQISNPDGNPITDKINWTRIEGEYSAIGGEQFITIGNFYDDANTDTVFAPGGNAGIGWERVYYYIDDVCISLDSLTCGWEVGIDEKRYQYPISIFPNPSEGIFQLHTEREAIGEIIIYNLFGKEVYRIYSNQKKKEINLQFLNKGAYLIKVTQKNTVVTNKLIID